MCKGTKSGAQLISTSTRPSSSEPTDVLTPRPMTRARAANQSEQNRRREKGGVAASLG